MSTYPAVRPANGTDFIQTNHTDTYPAIDSATKSDCTGKVVFVTGASKGVGRATSISYAKAGAEGIVVGARSDLSSLKDEIIAAAEAAGKKAPQVLCVKMDVQDEASVQAAVQDVAKTFGRLDILINNAGYLEPGKLLAESDSAEWWTTWEINIRGVYWVTKAALPLMLKGGDKTIVNVSSVGAHHLRQGGSGYQTSKFALLRFTEFIMADYCEQGVLAYAVHPGSIMTVLSQNMPERLHHVLTDKPEIAADTMVFLTSEKRDWLAGRYISCNWDMPEFLSKKDEIVKGDKLKMRMVF
ncbi:putative NAD-P-binding protein [Coleophoma cylindrospora]|uniref:Putative NAD-P-binding protein n=1 Tax=Coleophoma cylindrospora TaxID=1849047 RepID=A0A3D8STX3_9HELO|nr:putative NAD-P-binding protein [Coleophoma cylindrospora]